MPNQRRAGQTFIGFQTDAELLALVEAARRRDSRSLFVRQAVAEKLKRMGYDVTEDMIFGPDRAGSDTPERAAVERGGKSLATVASDLRVPPLPPTGFRLNEPGAGEEAEALLPPPPVPRGSSVYGGVPRKERQRLLALKKERGGRV